MASLCKFKLGNGDVDLQMVSGYPSAESEEQHAVHVRDHFPTQERLRWDPHCPAAFQTEVLGFISQLSYSD